MMRGTRSSPLWPLNAETKWVPANELPEWSPPETVDPCVFTVPFAASVLAMPSVAQSLQNDAEAFLPAYRPGCLSHAV
eukprot:COSAG02_NODE_4373_length_5439_cov_4.438764_5_plen_78_part_00